MDTQDQLRNRIEEFYRHLNQGNIKTCFDMIDPQLRNLLDYEKYNNSMSSFVVKYGPIQIVELSVSLYLGVEGVRDNRDFAYGTVNWTDKHQRPHFFNERWVKANDGFWHSRMLGLLGLSDDAQ